MPLYLGDKLISGRSRPIDAEPIENSLNLVTSGGVKKYVDDKVGTGTISGSGIAIQPEEPSDTDVWIDLDDNEFEELDVVTSFNGRDGEVVPETGDYTAEMVGADPSGSAASALASAKSYTDSKVPTKTSQLTNDSGFITNPVDSDLLVNGSVEVASSATFHDDVIVEGALFTTDEAHTYLHTGDILDYAAPAGYGLGTKAVDISEKNITEIAFGGKWGLYRGNNVIGAPSAPAWHTYEVFPSYGDGIQGYATIVATNINDGVKYICAVVGTTITPWKQLATTDDINNLTPASIGAAASSHNQAAGTITAGTFAGQVVANSSAQTYSTYLLRNTRLASSDTKPTVNGQICWTYG